MKATFSIFIVVLACKLASSQILDAYRGGVYLYPDSLNFEQRQQCKRTIDQRRLLTKEEDAYLVNITKGVYKTLMRHHERRLQGVAKSNQFNNCWRFNPVYPNQVGSEPLVQGCAVAAFGQTYWKCRGPTQTLTLLFDRCTRSFQCRKCIGTNLLTAGLDPYLTTLQAVTGANTGTGGAATGSSITDFENFVYPIAPSVQCAPYKYPRAFAGAGGGSNTVL